MSVCDTVNCCTVFIVHRDGYCVKKKKWREKKMSVCDTVNCCMVFIVHRDGYCVKKKKWREKKNECV